MISGKIESIAFGGCGILRAQGQVIFVPFAAPGDQVTVTITEQKKRHAVGKILDLIPSSTRITPPCPHFGTCGGCQLQHIDYATQLEIKRRFVADNLERIGKITFPIPPVIPAEQQWQYRRHIRLNLRKKGSGFIAGYIGHDNQTFLPITQCPLFGDLSEVQASLAKLANEGIEEGSLRLYKNLWAFSFFPRLPTNATSVIKHPAILKSPRHRQQIGEIDCSIEVDGLQFRYSPFGFIQNHPEQSGKIYQAVIESIKGPKVLDLYCGIGITSILLARKGFDVIGIENHPETVQLAKLNAQAAQVPVRFIEANAEDAINTLSADCVLVNPPRTGLAPQLITQLLHKAATQLIYISCMPATLARDLKHLVEGGYTIDKIQAFDMFPQTTHVETVVWLTNRACACARACARS